MISSYDPADPVILKAFVANRVDAWSFSQARIGEGQLDFWDFLENLYPLLKITILLTVASGLLQDL